jgi:hypothetical protein
MLALEIRKDRSRAIEAADHGPLRCSTLGSNVGRENEAGVPCRRPKTAAHSCTAANCVRLARWVEPQLCDGCAAIATSISQGGSIA